ncbi:hypothetical protein ACEPAH_1384 [Sanghuangporus vaninii]
MVFGDEMAGRGHTRIAQRYSERFRSYCKAPHTQIDPLVNLTEDDIFSLTAVAGIWTVDVLPFLRYIPAWNDVEADDCREMGKSGDGLYRSAVYIRQAVDKVRNSIFYPQGRFGDPKHLVIYSRFKNLA